LRTDQEKENEMAGYVARRGAKRNACTIMVGKPEGKGSLGRPRRRRSANIEITLREIGRGGMDWVHLAEDRVRWRLL
jgi:hypothetical protein